MHSKEFKFHVFDANVGMRGAPSKKFRRSDVPNTNSSSISKKSATPTHQRPYDDPATRSKRAKVVRWYSYSPDPSEQLHPAETVPKKLGKTRQDQPIVHSPTHTSTSPSSESISAITTAQQNDHLAELARKKKLLEKISIPNLLCSPNHTV